MLTAQEYYALPRVNLTGQVDDQMVRDMDMQIRNINAPSAERVVVALSTTGGFVGSARTIYDELVMLQEATDVTLVARGACMSAGVTIAMAVPKKNRLATPNTKFLIHEASLQFSPLITGPLTARNQLMDIATVNHEDDKREAEDVYRKIAKGCGISIKKVRKLAYSGVYVRGEEAIEYGLVSGILKAGKRLKREPTTDTVNQ